jgi:hypothetical protein
MVTGINTDVRYAETVFHAQTEDLGSRRAEICTLVFLGGQILQSIQRPYPAPGADKIAIQNHLQTQHRTVVQAILQGRFTSDTTVNRAACENPSLLISPLETPRSGTSISVMILLRADRSFEPLDRALIRIRYFENSIERSVLFEGRTSKRGFCMAEFSIPESEADRLELIIDTESKLGKADAHLDIRQARSVANSRAVNAPAFPETKPVLLVSDLERPCAGAKTSFMILVSDERSCQPIEAATIRLLHQSDADELPVVLIEHKTNGRGFCLAEAEIPGAGYGTNPTLIIEAQSSSGTSEVVVPVLVPVSGP